MAETKKCFRCKVVKPTTEFHRHSQSRDGFHPRCKDCKRSHRMESFYGITIEQYWAMYEAQKGLCALCNQPEKAKSSKFGITKLCIDHNHETGEIRGLLCRGCNWRLGWIEENFDLQAVANYLNRGESHG